MTDQHGALPTSNPTRRRLLLAGTATAAASAAALAAARPAEAANGQGLVLGRSNGQTLGTSLAGPSSAPSLSVTNTGAGAAASFQSTSSNGLGGGTLARDHYGLSASNKATTRGAGSAMIASGGVNTGFVVTTAGPDRNAVSASHRVPLMSASGSEAAVAASGGNANGVLAESSNVDTLGLLAAHYGGGVGALGASDGDGSIGVMGVASSGGAGVYALADDTASLSLVADGTAQFLTDVVVMGTLYAPTVVNGLPPAAALVAADKGKATTRSAGAQRVARRAARTAARIRAARTP